MSKTKRLTTNENYPEEMRNQLWPLCCGAQIVSGFKQCAGKSSEEITKMIEEALKDRPDLQVYTTENMNPKIKFIVLNNDQFNSATIRNGVTGAGFREFLQGMGWSGTLHFFVRDDHKTNTLKQIDLNKTEGDSGLKAA